MLKFTKKERRSLLIFAWTIIGLLVIRYWLSHQQLPLTILSPPSSVESVEKRAPFSSNERVPRSTYTNDPPSGRGNFLPEQATSIEDGVGTGTAEAPEMFDPNLASLEVMIASGLPRRVAHTILNYREKGGRFYKKEDLLKIYVMTDSVYRLVEPWVDIPPPPKAPERSRPRDLIDINAADIEEWTWLPGIGKGYAGRICRFRSALGGFVSVDQVGETFGLPDTVFHRIRPMLTLNTPVDGIEINQWTAEALAGHPYIRAKEARILVNYRRQHGPYRDVEGIRISKAIADTQRMRQLLPYWRF
ncbi:MAG: helix-hairpin-helix domain-containing protein [Saprospiraceae bacterium]|nr:helix-hairpin-helix domain-containing protein [Saprospiraceae bacterium]